MEELVGLFALGAAPRELLAHRVALRKRIQRFRVCRTLVFEILEEPETFADRGFEDDKQHDQNNGRE